MRSSQGLCKTGTHFSGPFAKDLGKVLKSKDCSSGNYFCVKGENSFFFVFFLPMPLICVARKEETSEVCGGLTVTGQAGLHQEGCGGHQRGQVSPQPGCTRTRMKVDINISPSLPY